MTKKNAPRAQANVPETNGSPVTRRIAFCGILTGFGALIMLTGGLLAVMTYCAPLAAALLLLPAADEYGTFSGFLVWLATALISLLIGADKEAAFFYIFLGWYPLAKPAIDRVSNGAARRLLKLLLFSAAIGLMYWLLLSVFRMGSVSADFNGFSDVLLGVFCLALAVIMLLYDKALDRMTLLYLYKLKPKLRKLRKG